MKKPLMLVPPAQAEALYDAALHDARSGWPPSAARPTPPWGAREWDDEETRALPDTLRPPLSPTETQWERRVANAQD